MCVIIILGENVIEQINQVKEERLHLESIKEELTKKVEQLFEQNRLTQHDGKVYYIF